LAQFLRTEGRVIARKIERLIVRMKVKIIRNIIGRMKEKIIVRIIEE